jgi:hypothetical protein
MLQFTENLNLKLEFCKSRHNVVFYVDSTLECKFLILCCETVKHNFFVHCSNQRRDSVGQWTKKGEKVGLNSANIYCSNKYLLD